MEKGDGDVNPMLEGQKMIAIFGFCDIRNFTDTTEILMEKVMLFVNEIAEITHGIVHKYGGAANKNIGDAFLLVWKFQESDILTDKETGTKHLKPISRTVKNLCDCALISFLKIIAKINKHPKILKYRENVKLNERMEGYKVKMGFGLHVGWAIEGAIGSVYKIDASYLSPNVNLSSRLEAATKQYGVPLLISGPLVKTMSSSVQEICREIDTVTVKGSNEPVQLFTVDVDPNTLTPSYKKLQVSSKEHYNEQRLELKKALDLGTKKTIAIIQKSNSITKMRKFITPVFVETWKQGYQCYKQGQWVEAKDKFEIVKGLMPEDGPCHTLYQFIGEHKYLAPKEWKGYRMLTDK